MFSIILILQDVKGGNSASKKSHEKFMKKNMKREEEAEAEGYNETKMLIKVRGE